MVLFPVGTMIRFCHNHGLIQVADRPQWHTVRGGSQQYVRKMVSALSDARLNTPVRRIRRTAGAGVYVATDAGEERFDQVVLACHSDQALALLSDASAAEQRWLGQLRYHANEAVLHTDASVLPQRRLAWAAWNYERAGQTRDEHAGVCLHYLINRLQPLPWSTPVIVSLNPRRPIDEQQVIARFDYAHPIFDEAAVAAQSQWPQFQGAGGVWFCGAWTRYGFHEDGLMSGLSVVEDLRRHWAARPSALAA